MQAGSIHVPESDAPRFESLEAIYSEETESISDSKLLFDVFNNPIQHCKICQKYIRVDKMKTHLSLCSPKKFSSFG